MMERTYRKISKAISPWIAKIMTPNQVTLFNFLFFVPLSAFFFYNSYAYINLLIGTFFLWMRGLFDRIDGDVARLRSMTTSFGAKLDTFTDQLGMIIIIICTVMGVYAINQKPIMLTIGCLIIFGIVLTNITSHQLKYAPLFSRRPFFIPTYFLIAGAIFNQIYFILIIMAVMINIRWIVITVSYLRKNKKGRQGLIK